MPLAKKFQTEKKKVEATYMMAKITKARKKLRRHKNVSLFYYSFGCTSTNSGLVFGSNKFNNEISVLSFENISFLMTILR